MGNNISDLMSRILEIMTKLFGNIYIQRIFIILVSSVAILLLVITPVYFFLDSKSYDVFMTTIKRPIVQDESLMLIDIDDNVMNNLPYSWPFPRSLHGDAIEVLADFGAKAAVFDVEFLGQSAIGANIDEIDESKNELAEKLQTMLDLVINTTNQVMGNPDMRANPIPLWSFYNEEFSNYYREVDRKFKKIVQDYDGYFANRLRYFGRAYGTVNMLYISGHEEDLSSDEVILSKEYIQTFGLKKEDLLKGKSSHPSIEKVNIAEFPNEKILKEYKQVGFTRVDRDKDGASRQVSLFLEKDGYIIPQLSFSPFLNIYDIKAEQIDLSSNDYVILRDVVVEKGDSTADIKKVTIKIPMYNGRMNVNWPSGTFLEIFASNKEAVLERNEDPQHFSYMTLLNYKREILKKLKDVLEYFKGKEMEILLPEENRYYQEYITFIDEKKRLIDNDPNASQMIGMFSGYFEDYLTRLQNHVSEENTKKKIDEIEKRIRGKKLTKQQSENIKKEKEEIVRVFQDVRYAVDAVFKTRRDLKILEGKICFIGLTATGTTDISPQPFQKNFENVGTHPSVYNTILQRDFIRIVPWWLIFIITFLIFGALSWILNRKTAMKASLVATVGFSSILIAVISIGLFYYFTNVYISPVIPFLYGSLSFVMMIVLKFILSEKEKSSIRNAFNKYLSPVVIGEILKDPSKLELGGTRAECTAIFTDIQGFSSISENFMNDAKGLVNLLNKYLSAMSDVILNNRGTIDKYEGDAIIAFFGMPVRMKDHAFRACLSSLQMKEIERDLNKKMLEDKTIDKPLLTRIGINTGEMFVGNMGTTEKFNYTIMGHAVNLAARLEGVNKQYGTYQLVSEKTHEQVKEEIFARKLDRVRVVNIKTPVRLFELVSLRAEMDLGLKELMNIFARGLEEFEKRKWKEALTLFKKVLQGDPNDGPSKIYIDRCIKYIKKEPPNWDGVYSLTSK